MVYNKEKMCRVCEHYSKAHGTGAHCVRYPATYNIPDDKSGCGEFLKNAERIAGLEEAIDKELKNKVIEAPEHKERVANLNRL